MSAAGMFLTWLLVLVFYDRRNAFKFNSFRPRIRKKMLVSLFVLAIPLGLVMAVNSFVIALPRYFIEHYHGERELGIFAAIASLAVLGRMVATAMSKSAAPRLAKHINAKKITKFTRLLMKLILIGAVVGIVGVVGALLIGEWFLAVFFGPEYAVHNSVLIWVMVSTAIATSFVYLGTAMTAWRNLKAQAVIVLCKCVLVLVVCYTLIPEHKSIGGAWGLLAGNGFSALLFIALTVWTVTTFKRNNVPSMRAN
jgi:O-antigen/teichoic acid export membrane protein